MPTQRQQNRAADRGRDYFNRTWGQDDNTFDLVGKWLPILGALGLGGAALAPLFAGGAAAGAAGTAAAGGGVGGAAAAPAAGVSWSGPYLGGGMGGGFSGVTGSTGIAGANTLPLGGAPAAKAGLGAAGWAKILRGGGQLAQGLQGYPEEPVEMQVPEVGPYQARGYDQTRALIAALFGEGGGY